MAKINFRLIGLIIALCMFATLFAACGNTSKNTPADNSTVQSQAASSAPESTVSTLEPITLKMFDKNTGDPFGQDDVTREIIKQTGVTLEIQQPSGNPAEKLNILLASGDLPDLILMDRSSDLVNKYIAAQAFIPLNELIDKYGPDIKQMYGNVLTQSRYTDGKNYYLNNWYGVEQEPVFSFLMRKDLLKEVAGDKAEGGQPFTSEEFENILKQVKAQHPKLNGHDTIPFTIWAENWGAFMGTFKGMYGMKTYFEDNGALKFDWRDPRFLDMLKYINKLYTEGLIDKEWAVVKRQLWEQKLSGGYVFATQGAYWDIGGVNGNLEKATPGSGLYSYKVTAPGVDPSKTTFGPRSGLGWDAIGITKNNKYPERTMQFMNFLASEKGQYLLMWGLEGVSWDMKDGKHTPKQEVLDGFKKDWGAYSKQTGIRKWTYFVKNGLGSDGTPYDLPGRYQRAEADLMAIKNLKDSVWDTAPYDGLNPAGGTPEALIAQKLDDLSKQSFTKIVIAKSPAEVEELYKKFVVDADAAGAAKVEQVITDNYKAREALWK